MKTKKLSKKILEKHLNQLENIEPNTVFPEEITSLVGREIEFAKKPLKDFTPENLRFMIQQKLGWKYLIPMAIEVLTENPLISGDLYEGDLLKSVVSVDKEFWENNPELWYEVEEIIVQAEIIIETFQQTILPEITKFRKNNPDGQN